MTQHTFRVTIERTGEAQDLDGGLVTFTGEDYEGFGEAQALTRLMPGGGGPEELDLSLPGFVRWRGILMPAADFRRLEVTLVAKSL